ncbi:hypothetical protein MCHI_001369 [Candidatus Magnetoovum chiemensis]|nr:hypothetical protein MCHI_001369 [Candidatus Magnetoovum chiemensis]
MSKKDKQKKDKKIYSDKRLPTIKDFSLEATNKAVIKETMQSPLSLYSTALGVLGAAASVVFEPSLALVGLAAGGLSLGVGSWIVNYFFRGDTYAGKYIERLNEQLEAYKQITYEKVEKELTKCENIPGAEKYAKQAVEQFSLSAEKFNNFLDILQSKLDTNELTYSRYSLSAEKVYLSVLDNLEEILSLLKSISSIDEQYIKYRLKEVDDLEEQAPADIKEKETLNERFQLLKKQLDRVNTLLTANEEAMTALDQTTAAFAAIKTSVGNVNVDMETARKELEELAKRAHEYSSRPM